MKISSKRSHLVIITIISAIWLFTAFIAPIFAPFEFDESENMIKVITDEGVWRLYAPHEPSKRHIFGTDRYGYDVFSSLLYGAKYTILTMLITAFLRVFGGFVIGYYQAMRSTIRKRRSSFSLIQGLPIFIIIYFLLFGFIFNPTLSNAAITAIQIMLFSLFGLPSTIPVFREKLSIQLKSNFIEAARSSGGGDRWILIHHVFPHSAEELVIQFTHEIVATLTLIGQLGVFSVFIGGTVLTTYPTELTSRTREWGGIIGQNIGKIGSPVWWVLGYPLAAYLLLFFSSLAVSFLIEKKNRKTYFKASNL